MKKISVIIPCYNVSEDINITLENLVNQTIGLNEVEIILVDDCSVDGGYTQSVLNAFREKYPGSVQVISLNNNVKQGGARNIALKHATGKYVMYCDADDWYVLNAFELAYKMAEKSQVDVLEYQTEQVYTHEKIISYAVEKEPLCAEINTIEERKRHIVSNTGLACWNRIYRRDFLVNNGINFSEGIYSEEVPFALGCLAYEKRMAVSDVVLYYYYQNQYSCTNTISQRRLIKDALQAYIDFFEFVKADSILFDECRNELEFVFWIGFFLLPIIQMSSKLDDVYSEEEYDTVTSYINTNISDICRNKYFIERFGDFPAIGQLSYLSSKDINLLELKEMFKNLSI